jgi:hypothetical protein
MNLRFLSYPRVYFINNIIIGELNLDDNRNIYDDLKKLTSNKKFLEITKLDLSSFSITSDVINLLMESEYVAKL